MIRTELHYQQAPFFSILPRDNVRALHAPLGEDHEGEEHLLDVGASGIVDSIDELGNVHVVYWLDDGERCIVQSYSRADNDLDSIEFVCRGADTGAFRGAPAP
jgi:hypothetical protein